MCVRKIAFELRHALGYSDAGILFSERALEVDDVLVDSPAYKAGIKKGDRIVAINNMPVESPQDMQDAVKKFGLDYQGLAPHITIERDGTVLEIVVELPTIPKRPREEKQEEKKIKPQRPDMAI